MYDTIRKIPYKFIGAHTALPTAMEKEMQFLKKLRLRYYRS
jgi:hypothetical protein